MSVVEMQRDGNVAIITINRVEAHNSISPEVAVRLSEAWNEVKDNDDIRVAIVTGAGERTFCAGADLGQLIPLITGARKPENEFDEAVQKNPLTAPQALLRDFNPEKPIIAAINGFTIAGGLELMLATDIRVAVPEAKFGMQEAKWAIFPAGGSTVRLPQQVAYAHAMEILLTGELISAERALAIGLINHIVPRESLMDKAMEIATQIGDNGPLAVKAIRKSVRECIGLTEKEALAKEMQIGMPIFASKDAREGPKAFKEKRKPVFTGE